MTIKFAAVLFMLLVQTLVVSRMKNKKLLYIIPFVFLVVGIFLIWKHLSMGSFLGILLGTFILLIAGITRWDEFKKEKQEKYIKEKYFDEKLYGYYSTQNVYNIFHNQKYIIFY